MDQQAQLDLPEASVLQAVPVVPVAMGQLVLLVKRGARVQPEVREVQGLRDPLAPQDPQDLQEYKDQPGQRAPQGLMDRRVQQALQVI